jgi:hypothetical protein
MIMNPDSAYRWLDSIQTFSTVSEEILAEEYLRLGDSFQNINNDSLALSAYQRALMMDNLSSTHVLNGRILNKIGTVLMSYGLTEDAIHVFLRACNAHMLMKDEYRLAGTYERLAVSYSQTNYDSCIYFYQKALDGFQNLKDFNRAYHISLEMGCYYYTIGNLDKAKEFLFVDIPEDSIPGSQLLYKGMYCMDTHNYTEAEHYLKMALKDDSYETKCIIYKLLGELEGKRNHNILSNDYLSKAKHYKDLLDKRLPPNRIERIHLRTNYLRAENENQVMHLKYIQEKRQKNIFLIVALIFILGVGTIICVYARYRALKRRSLEKSRASNTSLQQPVIYSELQHLSKEDNPHVSQEQWDEVQRCIDALFNDFTKRLYEHYSQLSEQELHMCYLIKMGISPSGISRLLFKSKSAVTMSRTRLYKKIFGKDGSAEMFDAFIMGL